MGRKPKGDAAVTAGRGSKRGTAVSAGKKRKWQEELSGLAEICSGNVVIFRDFPHSWVSNSPATAISLPKHMVHANYGMLAGSTGGFSNVTVYVT